MIRRRPQWFAPEEYGHTRLGKQVADIVHAGGRAGLGKGNFYAEPLPQINLHGPSRLWHLGKVVYEKYWLDWRF